MPVAELDDYLEGEKAETQLDSHGHFTLALEQSRQRFAAYGSQLSCGFVLKLVQAACCLQASRVFLDQSDGQLVLTVEVSPEAIDLDDLFDHFEAHLLAPVDGWQRYFCRALLSACHQTSRASFLAIWDGKNCRQVRSFPAGSDLTDLRLFREPSLVNGLIWQIATPQDWKLDLETLLARLAFCPIPLLYNRRMLSFSSLPNELRLNGWRLPCSLGTYSSSPLVGQLLADFYCVEEVGQPSSMILRPATSADVGVRQQSLARVGNFDGLPWLKGQFPALAEVPYRGLMGVVPQPLPQVRVKGQLGSGRGAVLVDLETTGGTLQAAFMSGVAGDKLCPIVRGVMLEPVLGGWHCSGLEAVAALSNLPTDLTGERLLEGSQLADWFARYRPQLADWLELPLARLEPMSCGKMPFRFYSVVGAGLGSLCMLLAGESFVAIHAGVMGGLYGEAMRQYLKYRNQRKPNPELAEFYRVSLVEMQRQLRRHTTSL